MNFHDRQGFGHVNVANFPEFQLLVTQRLRLTSATRVRFAILLKGLNRISATQYTSIANFTVPFSTNKKLTVFGVIGSPNTTWGESFNIAPPDGEDGEISPLVWLTVGCSMIAYNINAIILTVHEN